MKRWAAIAMPAAALVIADAVVKFLAARYLRGQSPFAVIPGFLSFAYVENRGCAWGMFQGHVWPLALFGLAALAVLIWQRRRIFYDGAVRESRWSMATEILLYAGIVGNLIDRVFRGAVIDMIDCHWHEAYHFPCFNVADICITCAATLLVIQGLFSKSRVTRVE